MQNPRPSGIIEAFRAAVNNLNAMAAELAVAPALPLVIGYDFGERYEVSPSNDWQYPQVFLELPMKMEPLGNNAAVWSFSMLYLENVLEQEDKPYYQELYGRTYEQALNFINELRKVFAAGSYGALNLADMVTLYDDFSDNCSGYRVELRLTTVSDIFVC